MGSRKLILSAREEVLQSYLKYQVSIAQLLGANESRVWDDLAECIRFEIKLAKVSSL